MQCIRINLYYLRNEWCRLFIQDPTHANCPKNEHLFNPLYTDNPLIQTLSMPPLTSVLTGFDCTRVMFPWEREIDRVTFSCLTHFFLPVTVSTLCGFRDGIENLSNFPFSPLTSLPCLPSRVLLTRTFSRLPCMEANPWWFLVPITLR